MFGLTPQTKHNVMQTSMPNAMQHGDIMQYTQYANTAQYEHANTMKSNMLHGLKPKGQTLAMP